ncbi:MAG: lipocalin-like domain-containing protein [Bacteroidaceae bacterium]
MLKLHDFYAFYETAGPLGTERHSEEKLLTDSATTLLQPFGIDGLFANFNILKLTGSSMILQSDYARLVMRKF